MHQKWSPLPAHVVKVHVGAAIRCDETIASLEVVIRDSYNKIIVAAIQQTQLDGDVKYVAVEAIKWGFQAARNTEFQSKVVEIDCQNVASLVNNKQGSKSEILWIISKIQSNNKDFQHVKCQCISRLCNAYALSLAKLTLRHNSLVVWLDSLPAKIKYFYWCELMKGLLSL